MNKETRTLYLSFNDNAGNKKNIAIRNPMINISAATVKEVADTIIENNLMLGEVGFLTVYNGAYIVVRKTQAVA